MKSRLTLLLLLITSITFAQYDYYYHEPTVVGGGVGTNLVSVVGNDVTPVEISMRVRINRKHTLQLYMPYFRQSNSFNSKDIANEGFIQSSLQTKKTLYGVGLDYDYALHTYSSLDFVIGLRGEFHLHKYRTELTNTHPAKNNYNNIEFTHRSKEQTNYIVSPNAGLRLNFNQFSVDAKFLLSMLSTRGDIDTLVERKTGQQPNMSSTTTEWTDELSNKFKLKPGIVASVSYYFQLSAISFQPSAISFQPSAFSTQHSAFSNQHSAISYQHIAYNQPIVILNVVKDPIINSRTSDEISHFVYQ